MRKVLILSVTVLFLLILSSSVFAAGWHTIGTTDNPDAGQWLKTNTPHKGLPSSTNACKACHAVHESDSDSFKLLHDDGRNTECDACHAATGSYTDKKPYGIVTNPRGEHSIGDDDYDIPEASASVIGSNSVKDVGLTCGNCHSVHDAYSLGAANTSGQPVATLPTGWENKILRRDPANNGGDVLDGMETVRDPGDAVDDKGTPDTSDDEDIYMPGVTGNPTANEIQAAFCGDCHNKNPNWSVGNTDTAEGTRPNPAGHALGGVDGKIDVYGQVRSILTGDGSNAQYLSSTCESCHKRVSGNTDAGLNDQWPHQSRSEKFLGRYNGTSVVEFRSDAADTTETASVGDPKRIIQSWDSDDDGTKDKGLDSEICRECHNDVGQPGGDPNETF